MYSFKFIKISFDDTILLQQLRKHYYNQFFCNKCILRDMCTFCTVCTHSDTMYNYQIASHQGNRHVLSEFFIDISLSSQATQPSEDRGTEELLFFAFWLDCRWRFVRTVIIIVVIMAVFTTVGFSSLGFVWLDFSQIYITITIDLMMMTMIMVSFHYLTAHREKRVCLTACALNCINIISIFHVILCYYTTFCFYIMKIWCDHHGSC